MKSCSNNLNSPAGRAVALCSRGYGEKRRAGKGSRKVCGSSFGELEKVGFGRDERKGRKKKTKTHQIRLLTARIIHFCPRRLRFSAWLGGKKKTSSAAVHLAHTGTPTSARLKQTPLCAESWSWRGGRSRCGRPELLWPTLVAARRRSHGRLSHAAGTLFFGATTTVLQPRKQPPPPPQPPHPPPPPTSSLPPSSSHPPTHTHTNIYNSPLPARNSQ